MVFRYVFFSSIYAYALSKAPLKCAALTRRPPLRTPLRAGRINRRDGVTPQPLAEILVVVAAALGNAVRVPAHEARLLGLDVRVRRLHDGLPRETGARGAH